MPPWLAHLDLVADLASILAAIAVISTAAFVWRQTSLQAQSESKDARRFLRESIFVVHDMLQAEQFRNARQNFFGQDRHVQEFSDMTADDKGRARYILSVYGLLSSLIDHNAVDEDVARGYWKTALYRDWDRLENFVSGERLRSGIGTRFAPTEKMVNRWKKADSV